MASVAVWRRQRVLNSKAALTPPEELNMNRLPVFAALLVALGLSAPAWGQGPARNIEEKQPLRTRFDVAEAAQLMEVGETALTGQAFMLEKGSLLRADTKLYAKNEVVYLLPMNNFLKAWVEKYRGNGLANGRFELHPEVGNYAARVITDDEGRFRFRGLKSGEYLLWTVLRYEKDHEYLVNTGSSQTVTWSSYGIVTAAVREPVFRTAKATHTYGHNIIRLVTIAAGQAVVDLGGIHGDERGQ
jgi:hypothetical protein